MFPEKVCFKQCAKDRERACRGHAGVDGVFQTMQEMDFERGPWSSACNGDFRAVAAYLEKGGAPNLRDSSGYAPLHYAARNGHECISRILLQNGAAVDIETRSGMATPLHRAAGNNAVKVAELLLKHNADPCKQDSDGKTPLHKAVDGKSGEICRLLIAKNPRCAEIQDKNGKEAKHYVRATLEYSEVYKAVKWRK